jgi:hypothetical protein
MGDMINAYNILAGKPEGETPLGRPRHRWKDNVRMDLIEVGWEHVDWIQVDQDRDKWWALVNVVMNLGGAQKTGNFLPGLVTISFSRRTLLCVVRSLPESNENT